MTVALRRVDFSELVMLLSLYFTYPVILKGSIDKVNLSVAAAPGFCLRGG